MKIAKKDNVSNGVKFSFIDGTVITPELDEFSPEMIHELTLHGLRQKLGDSYASADSVEAAIASLQSVYQNLLGDNWNAKVSRGGKIVEAMVRATGETYERCMEVFAKLDEDAKKALRKKPQIKLAMAEIEHERQSKLAEADSSGGSDLNDMF